MATKDVDVMVEGGKATAAPPIGPALSPMGVNVGKVVAGINEKTKSFAGMTVPVKITIDLGTKDFTIAVGTPSVAALLKKEAKVSLGSGTPNSKKVGNISFDKAIEIAQAKDFPETRMGVMQVLGTALSMGITVDGKDPKEVQTEIRAGKYDSKLKA